MIFVALGANIPCRFGSPAQTIQAAKAAMDERRIGILQSSRTWKTAPVPLSNQPWYHNEVVSVQTELSPFALLESLQAIENDFGRVRTIRNAPRIIDLDLVAYDDTVIDRPELIVPHPRMHRRAFVLRPMRELTADWRHPLLGMSIDELIDGLDAGQQAVPILPLEAAEVC